MATEIKLNPFNYKSLTFLEMKAELDSNPLFATRPEWLKVLLCGRQDIMATYIDARANDSILPSMRTRRNVFNFARCLDYVAETKYMSKGRVTVTLKSDTLLPISFTKEDLLFSTSVSIGGEEVIFSAIQDEVFTVLTKTIDVWEGRQYSDDEGYVFDGSEYEEFLVTRLGGIKGTFSLVINEETWTEVDNLLDSQPTDKHFRVLFDYEGSIKLRGGNGEMGSSFPVGFSPKVVAWYGGGTRGNVPAGYVNKYVGTRIEVSAVTNAAVFSGGTGEESISSIKLNAPMQAQAQRRAVSDNDFKYLSQAFEGVVRACVVPVPYGVFSVQVQIVPTGGGVASYAVRTALATYLKENTLVGGLIVEVRPASYTVIDSRISVGLAVGANWPVVQAYVSFGSKCAYSEVLAELKEIVLSQGLETLIEYVNLLWGYSFTATDKATQIQIRKILDACTPLEWGADVEEYIFHLVARVITGVVYIEVDSLTGDGAVAQYKLAQPGVVTVVTAGYVDEVGEDALAFTDEASYQYTMAAQGARSEYAWTDSAASSVTPGV